MVCENFVCVSVHYLDKYLLDRVNGSKGQTVRRF